VPKPGEAVNEVRKTALSPGASAAASQTAGLPDGSRKMLVPVLVAGPSGLRCSRALGRGCRPDIWLESTKNA